MRDLIQKALAAKRESKHIEFKEAFDTNSPGEWCEVIKDLVAIANSGGGVIVFGLNSRGAPTGHAVSAIGSIDPADIANRLQRYVGSVDLAFEMCEVSKEGQALIAFVIPPASIPIVFQKPGTYDAGSGKQKNAFGVGTVYFRHGAKSEPGTTEDIRQVIERQLEHVRKSWIKGVRKVVEAAPGTHVVTVSNVGGAAPTALASTVRVSKDANAIPVRLTRDPSIATGRFVHEEVSNGIFDEINNVVDANRALARGRQQFLLGHTVYYRIYAERQHVVQPQEGFTLLFNSAMTTIYAPSAFWLLALPDTIVAEIFAHLYLQPINPQIHGLLRTAVLLGAEFSDWLYSKWHAKWRRHPQPPSFYHTFREMLSKLGTTDARLVAVRMTPSSPIAIAGEPTTQAKELLKAPDRAAALLSKVCMRASEGGQHASSLRALARYLDYFAYGSAITNRAAQLSATIISKIGDRQSGDVVEGSGPA